MSVAKIAGGIVLIAFPDPTTTAAGVTLVVDGVVDALTEK